MIVKTKVAGLFGPELFAMSRARADRVIVPLLSMPGELDRIIAAGVRDRRHENVVVGVEEIDDHVWVGDADQPRAGCSR